ncbi:MAG: helix-turn-helix transcriptional regulator [Lachnospiraceae bacterium]|nr:helix-turn-helix transcriptional regulator [Lachnospiraceae bacterium]
MNLSGQLTTLRQIKNIGQKVLAAYLNVSVATISNYENGVYQPDLNTLCRFAEYYGVSIDYLLGRSTHSASASVSQESGSSMELREKIFLETSKLSADSLHTLEWITRLLADYEITVKAVSPASYDSKPLPQPAPSDKTEEPGP